MMFDSALIPSLILYATILGLDITLEILGYYKNRGLRTLHFLPENVAPLWQILCTSIIYAAFGAWIYQDGLFGGLYLPELCALQFVIQATRRMYKLLKPVEVHFDASQS